MSWVTAPDGTDIWPFADTKGTILWVISDDAIYVASLTDEEADRYMDEMIEQGVAANVRMSKATTIPHKKVLTVFGDEKKMRVEIRYQSLKALASYGLTTQAVTLPNVDMFREMLDSFRRHFGDKAKYQRKEFSASRAMVAPVLTAVFIAALTWILAGGLGDMHENTPSIRHRISYDVVMKFVDALGHNGVIAVGLAGMLACAVWAYRRGQDPPIMIFVKPGK